MRDSSGIPRLLAGVALTMTPVAAYAQTPRQQPSQEASPATTSYPAAAAGDGTTTGGYNGQRWAEDWRAYADPAKRDDPMDQLKFLPLAADGDVYLTLSGELRLRVNMTSNPNLQDAEAQRQDIARIVGGADLHLGEHLRVFGELGSAQLGGRNLGNPAANLRNDLAVQQLFGEVKGEVAGLDAGIRIGRQTFSDGTGLLVVSRDNNTLLFTLDGVRAYARGKSVRADVFDFKYVRYGPRGLGDDPSDGTTRFSGGVVGFAVPTTFLGESQLFVDPFVYRLRDLQSVLADTTQREVRRFYGVHAYGDIGPVAIDWTVNHQDGRFGTRPIDAWQAFVAQTVRLGKGADAPRVGVHFDYGSGGGTYGTGAVHAANGLFGNNIYYSYALFLTPVNLQYVAPNVTFTALKGVRVALEYGFARKASEDDAVYRASGAALPGTQAVAGRAIGEVARAQLVWSITPRLSFTGRYEYLRAGTVLTRAGLKDSGFLAGWLSFRF